MTLFINCCPRGESRTEKLARALLKALGEYEELRLYDEPLHPLGRVTWLTCYYQGRPQRVREYAATVDPPRPYP